MRHDPLRHDPAPVARVCYAALRQLREEQGLARGPRWGLLVKHEQDWVTRWVELARRGLLPRDIHAAWQAELLDDDWKPGDEPDYVKKTHPYLYDWDDLDAEFRARLRLFQIMVCGMEFSHPVGVLYPGYHTVTF